MIKNGEYFWISDKNKKVFRVIDGDCPNTCRTEYSDYVTPARSRDSIVYEVYAYLPATGLNKLLYGVGDE